MRYTGRSLAIAGAILLGTAGTSAAAAQTTASEAGSGYVTQEDDEFPLGLLGLLGLAGLLGLKRKDDDRVNRASTADRR